MGLLDMLLGGGPARQEYEDFANRYDQGPPSEGYSDQEVLERYGAVSHKVPKEDYETAARDAFSRLSEEERREFARFLQQRARSRRPDLSPLDLGGEREMADPRRLARVTTAVHEQPGLLRELLGAVGGGGQTGAALAGITAMVVRRFLQPGPR